MWHRFSTSKRRLFEEFVQRNAVMKLTVERNDLIKATGTANAICKKDAMSQILANVLIQARDDKVTFRSTDNQLDVIQTLDATVTQAGSTTVGAHTLHEIARKLPPGSTVDVQMNYEDDTVAELVNDEGGQTEPSGHLKLPPAAPNQIRIVAARSFFDLATLPWEDFPASENEEYSSSFTIPAANLLRLFEKSRFAMSLDDARQYLNGSYLHRAQRNEVEVLRCVATDGHRLARVDVPLPQGAEELPGVILPAKTVGELCRLLDTEDGDVNLSVSNAKVRLATKNGSTVLTSTLVDGNYPNYDRVIPQTDGQRLEVDVGSFSAAVDRVLTVCSNTDTQAVALELDGDILNMRLTAPDSGKAEEKIQVAYGAGELTIGFNGRYLREIANVMERDTMTFWLKSANDQALIQSGDDNSAIYVVMPMRL